MSELGMILRDCCSLMAISKRARVLLFNDNQHVLLFCMDDTSGVKEIERRSWFTIGGELKENESYYEAAYILFNNV
jgi:hypothetical protein